MGDRSSAGWDCCHIPGQGEGLDNIHLTSKGGMKPASQGVMGCAGLPQFPLETTLKTKTKLLDRVSWHLTNSPNMKQWDMAVTNVIVVFLVRVIWLDTSNPYINIFLSLINITVITLHIMLSTYPMYWNLLLLLFGLFHILNNLQIWNKNIHLLFNEVSDCYNILTAWFQSLTFYEIYKQLLVHIYVCWWINIENLCNNNDQTKVWSPVWGWWCG